MLLIVVYCFKSPRLLASHDQISNFGHQGKGAYQQLIDTSKRQSMIWRELMDQRSDDGRKILETLLLRTGCFTVNRRLDLISEAGLTTLMLTAPGIRCLTKRVATSRIYINCCVSWISAGKVRAGVSTTPASDFLGSLFSGEESVMHEEGNQFSLGGGRQRKLQKRVSSDLYGHDKRGTRMHQ